MQRRARVSRLSLFVAVVFVLSAFPGPAGAVNSGPVSDRVASVPKAGDPATIAIDHLRGQAQALGLRPGDVRDVAITDAYTDAHNGVTHVYLRQRFRGIGVVGANANYNVSRNGSIISFGQSFISDLSAKVRSARSLNSAASVKSVARQLGIKAPASLKVLQAPRGVSERVQFGANAISRRPIDARLVYQPVGSVVKLAWQIELYEPSGAHWWSLRADAATGRILARSDYLSEADDRYNVFAIPKESPNDGGRTLVTNPATFASPNGWHNTDTDAARETTNTTGNNVNAYADRDNNDQPDPGSSPSGHPGAHQSLTFDFPLDLTKRPLDSQAAAVTNLFYWNNVIHDVLYDYGFDEPAGNFQLNNFTSTGLGGDAVDAEAQDGSGRNNANFGTPPEGEAPVMQMFEWRSSAPNPAHVNTGPLAGNTYFGPMGGFGESLVTTGPITGDVVFVGRGCDPDYPIGNTPPIPDDPYLADPAGKIALIDRGACTFVSKVKKAQDQGALMVIVANNQPAPPVPMGGADPSITIPSIMISQSDGAAWKPALPFEVTVSDGTGGAPDRDSDLDSTVIAHEYGHGLSTRLTGGPANVECLDNREQMGGGWSERLARWLPAAPSDGATTARGIGTYVNFEGSDGAGIRPTPYTTDLTVNDVTYQDVIDTNGVTLSIPHGVGYAWASMYWEVYWNLIEAHGFNPNIYEGWETGGNNLALQLMVDGMKFQPCSPGFVDGRDAILQADIALTGGDNQCLIWEGFAKRGLGRSAKQRSSNDVSDGKAAFDVPNTCGTANGPIVPIGLPTSIPTATTSGRHGLVRRRRRRGARRG